MPPNNELRRSLSLPLICLYGLGNILGAGIYVLIGKVAGEAGYFTPLAFVLASVIAFVTAFSFAELTSRYPVSAGEAVFVQEGFGKKQLSLLVGLCIILTGIVSCATIAKGFVGYLHQFVDVPDSLAIIALLGILGLVAIWGILESVLLAALFTFLEIGGLLLILAVTIPEANHSSLRMADFIPDLQTGTWTGIFSGAFLAFYAYVGFEDMVNVVEEVKNPRRNMPIAIITAIVLATLLYILVVIASLSVLTPAELGDSDAPLAHVFASATGRSPWLISIISMVAVVNGALIQIIMASRVCYGLARQHWLPEIFGRVNSKTRTPVVATLVLTAIIMAAALWFPIETLARTTSSLLLFIFTLVNISLLRIKQRKQPVGDIFQVPVFLPIIGTILCGSFLLAQLIPIVIRLFLID